MFSSSSRPNALQARRERTKVMGPEMEVPCWCKHGGDGFDFEGLAASGELIRKIIDAEVEAGVPKSRIVVAGFSQGATVSAWTIPTQLECIF